MKFLTPLLWCLFILPVAAQSPKDGRVKVDVDIVPRVRQAQSVVVERIEQGQPQLSEAQLQRLAYYLSQYQRQPQVQYVQPQQVQQPQVQQRRLSFEARPVVVRGLFGRPWVTFRMVPVIR